MKKLFTLCLSAVLAFSPITANAANLATLPSTNNNVVTTIDDTVQVPEDKGDDECSHETSLYKIIEATENSEYTESAVYVCTNCNEIVKYDVPVRKTELSDFEVTVKDYRYAEDFICDVNSSGQYLNFRYDKHVEKKVKDVVQKTNVKDFPKYRQSKGPWSRVPFTEKNMKGSSYTIACSGCGPTSLSIVLSGMKLSLPGYDGINFHGYKTEKDGLTDPAEAAKFVVDCGGKDRGKNSDSGSNMTVYCKAVEKAFANEFEGTNKRLEVVFINEPNAEKAYKMIKDEGYVAIANSNTRGQVSRTHFTAGGHYIAVVGVKDGKFIVIDPATEKRDGTSCSGCGHGCDHVEYTVDMMNSFKGVKGGGIRRWCLFRVVETVEEN